MPPYFVRFTSGFILRPQTVVLRTQESPSNFFPGLGGPCNFPNTLLVKCSLGDSESGELTIYVPRATSDVEIELAIAITF